MFHLRDDRVDKVMVTGFQGCAVRCPKGDSPIRRIKTEHERLLTLRNEQGVVEREVGRGWGDWVTMGTEGGTWRDEHWVLLYMLAN